MRKATALLCLCLLLLQGAFALEDTQWIKIPEDFAAGEWETGPYTAGYVHGGSEADIAALASGLLGPDYIENENGTLLEAKDGEIWEIRRMDVDHETGEISYWDPLVSSERGAEYEPPALGISRDEALEKCRGLLGGHMPEEYFARLNMGYEKKDRWHGEEKRSMGDAEYDGFCRERKLAYFRFDHAAENGFAFLGEGLTASVGANGLNGFTLNRHAFEAADGTAELMPLEQALEMASSTRSTETMLLHAEPVYSNWVSGDENFNLCWYIVTGRGNYVVDCVLGRHVCDSWEY